MQYSKRDTYDYLCHVEEPSDDELRELEKYSDFLCGNTSDPTDHLSVPEYWNKFSDIGELPPHLLDFSRTQRGKRKMMKESTPETTVTLNDLNLNKRLHGLLEKIGIHSVAELLSKTREDLRTSKLIGQKAIDEITQELLRYDLHLTQDEIFTCAQCSRKYADVKQNETLHYCRICQAKKDRIEQMSDIFLTLSQPEYASYTNTGAGFTIYANITNCTEDLQKIKLLEFYIVSDGQQRAPESFLTGYLFNEEIILPMTSKSCGKIWSRAVMKKDRLTKGDYAIITLAMDGRRYMFKFVFEENSWRIDDYYEEKM